METAELKQKINNQIDTFDNEKLERFYAVMLNFIDETKLSKFQHQGLLNAIDEMKYSDGIDNNLIIEKYKSIYTHQF